MDGFEEPLDLGRIGFLCKAYLISEDETQIYFSLGHGESYCTLL